VHSKELQGIPKEFKDLYKSASACWHEPQWLIIARPLITIRIFGTCRPTGHKRSHVMATSVPMSQPSLTTGVVVSFFVFWGTNRINPK